MKKILYLLLLTGYMIAGCKKSPDPSPVPPPADPPVVVPPSTDLPAGAGDGVVYVNGGTSAIVTLYAPLKNAVSLIGEFNNWDAAAGAMKKTPDGNTWWIQVNNLDPNTEYAYQFYVENSLRIADPYCEKILDPANDPYIPASVYPGLKAYPVGKTTGIVSVMQGNKPQYTWKNSNFTRPAKNDLVIYELLIRDFTTEHSYASTLQKLDYLVDLGINAIELMPVNEFEGNSSWGYNPSFYFAADKYYGTKTALQNFIDECHGKGIAVIIDMVLNHSFGQSPMVQLYFNGNSPTVASPWFNVEAKHPFNVGYDFNHESAATKAFAKNVIKFWMQEYKIDGFRFDLSKGFTQKASTGDDVFRQYDAGRVAIWKEYNSFIKSVDPNNFYVILEHFADVPEEKTLSDDGMMLWNNINYNMNEATMGWLGNSNFSWAFFSNHTFSKPDYLVTYMESHDEERLNFKNISYGNASGNYNVKELATALKRQEMAAAFLFAAPGPKMIWQFGELGYDISIEQGGRLGEKPVKWDYFSVPQRKNLYNVYSKLIRLKKKNSIFASADYSYSLVNGVKYVRLNEGANTVVVVGNFDVNTQTASINFGTAGTWTDALGGSNINLSGVTYTATLAPGEYHIFSRQPLN